MKDIKTLSSTEILSIAKDRPEKLYSKDNIESEFGTLRRFWHPDRNKDTKANEVFNHITNLHKLGIQLITQNIWNGPASIEFITAEGKTFRIHYKKMHQFELGNLYISSTKICYILKPEFETLFVNGINMLQNQVKYPHKKFEDEFKKYMPNIILIAKGSNIGHVLVLEKTEDVVMLQDLLDYLPDNKLDPKQVAWIISSLSNILCFFEKVCDVAHLGLSTKTIFVSPKFHSSCVYGGWWYSRPNDTKLLALPSMLANILPSSVLVDKRAKLTYDRMLVKAIGLFCMGDKSMTGSTLVRNPDIPKPVLKWLRAIPTDSSVKEYSNWINQRDEGFGKRKFIELIVDVNNIY